MKNKTIMIVLFCSALITTTLNSFSQEVNWSFEKVNLKSVLKSIEAESDLHFTYGNMKLSNKVTLNYSGELEGGLQKLLKPLNIEYKIIGNQIALKHGKIKGEKIRGVILDIDNKMPLIGATVAVLNSDPLIGTTTDIDGKFSLPVMPVGRYDLKVGYLGYKESIVPQILVSTGKEVSLNIELQESTEMLEEVVISAKLSKSEPLNDMATLSARSFSVEETKRFAAAVSDPARMAQSYAGVSSGGDDLSNEIIVRGNSAKGLLWRLEGIEIPNPNHFSGLGAGGGAVSMLSSSTLATSDFYTGAFPAEFGNALSGVFDLRMRNGNTEKREHSIMVGILGLEVASEGPFKKGSNTSYLFNYRYSTLGLLSKFLPSLEGNVPSYQDFSFKMNVPTNKAGTFSFFGLGGINTSEEFAIYDSTQWVTFDDYSTYDEKQRLGVVGLTHNYLLKNNKSYFKTSLVGSIYTYYDLTQVLTPNEDYTPIPIDDSKFNNYDISGSIAFNHKFNARHNIRTGIKLNHKIFNYDYKTIEFGNVQDFFNNSGTTQYFESYLQWKYRITDRLTLNTGVNIPLLLLNNTYSIDPRLGLKWQFKENQSLSFAFGLHSKPEHISTYFIERFGDDGAITSPNRDLSLLKAIHSVVGYQLKFAKDFRLQLEGYYQYLYDIPVSSNIASGFSVLNSGDVFDIIFMNDESGGALVSNGKGFNYGIDITLEKFFSKGYYFLITTSIFDSKYSTIDGIKHPTAYANNFILNTLGGKEFVVGKKKKNIFALNAKFTLYGGRRDNPIDLESSINAQRQVEYYNEYYEARLAPYYRFDFGLAYTINAKKASHSFLFDVQNLTNRLNIETNYFNPETNTIESATQNGAIPFINYKVEF